MKCSHVLGFFLLFSLSLSTAQAAVRLNMTVNNGGEITHPQLTTEYGLPVSVSHRIKNSPDSIEFVAVTHRHPLEKGSLLRAVTLDFEIARLSGNQRIPLAQPRVTALLGEKASISQTSSSGELIEFEFIASEL